MNVVRPHVVAGPDALRDLRLQVAMGQKARHVNLCILFRQHDEELRSAAQRCDRSARAATERLMEGVRLDARWTTATTRDLKVVVRGLTAAIMRLNTATATAESLSWLRDRAAEIAAQDAQVIALEAVLAAHRALGAHKVSRSASKRRRRG